MMGSWFNDWVDVKKSSSGLSLYLSFREGGRVLGPILTPYPTTTIIKGDNLDTKLPVFHRYPTEMMLLDEAKSLADRISSVLGAEHVEIFGRTKEYDIMFAKMGVHEKPNERRVVQIRDVGHSDFLSLGKMADEFIPGKYAYQAKRQLGWPYRIVELDDKLLDIVDYFNEANIYLFRAGQEERWKKTGEYQIALEMVEEINSMLTGETVSIDPKRKQLQMAVPDLAGVKFTKNRLALDDLLKLPHAFIDTEKKLFSTEAAQNNFVGLLCIDSQGRANGSVHTTERAEDTQIASQVNGHYASFTLHYHDTEIEMVKAASETLYRAKPYLLFGHNISYDLGELRGVRQKRSHNGFAVGMGGCGPRVISAMGFPKKMAIPGMGIIDTMQMAKTCTPNLPAKDLETVAGITKSISYVENERLTRYGDPGSKRHRYLISDVHSLHGIVHGRYRELLGCVYSCAVASGVTLEEALHSSRCAEKIRDEEHFSRHGTYREAPSKQSMLRKAQERFTKQWPVMREEMLAPLNRNRGVVGEGVYDVTRFYLPFDRWMGTKSMIMNPGIVPVMRSYDEGNDKEKIATLGFLRALNKEPWLHYFLYREAYYDAREKISDAGLLLDKLESTSRDFFYSYGREDTHGKEALIRKHFGCEFSVWRAREGIDRMVYARNVAWRFGEVHGISVDKWERRAKEYSKVALAWIDSSNLRIAYRDGLWLYVIGDTPPDGPLVHAGNFKALKVNDHGDNRIIYREAGRFHGLRVSEKKPGRRTIYENRGIMCILDAMIDADIVRAEFAYQTGREALRKGEVDHDDLLLNVPGGAYQFKGLSKEGEYLFTYTDREDSLPDFVPDLAAYVKRYERYVGRWMRKCRELFGGKQGKLF